MGKLHRKFNKHVCSAHWRLSVSPTLSNAAPLTSNCPVYFEKQLSWSSFWKLMDVHFGNPVVGFPSSSKSFSLSSSPAAHGTLGQDPLLSRVMTVGPWHWLVFLLPRHTPSPLPPLYWIQWLSQRPCLCVGTAHLEARECCYHSQSLMYMLATRTRHPTATAWVSRRV